ncbi:MAG: hypothetical protein QG594_2284, partial [Bacteroidota bacterium]|nr:hypothetical protein [Bacteroidota bacterium]
MDSQNQAPVAQNQPTAPEKNLFLAICAYIGPLVILS